jgi:hypothetical protein
MKHLFGIRIVVCVLFGVLATHQFRLSSHKLCGEELQHPTLPKQNFRVSVIDADTGEPIPARVYLRNSEGKSLFVESESVKGSALPYQEQWVAMASSVEKHTTVSAHPFQLDLPKGKYVIEIERGKEYVTFRDKFEIKENSIDRKIRLKRWIDLSKRGWYSGETHVHRRIEELPNTMLAEDLNVAFPVTFWTIASDQAPSLQPSPLRGQGLSPFGPRVDRGHKPIYVDREHVIFPRNTEYEIFSVNGKSHVLGAVFILNHRNRFLKTMPPVASIAKQAHQEGAMLDLDKHSWPWSIMLVPVAGVDLFELSNNSIWRTKFGFNKAPANPPPWANLEFDSNKRLTEWGWITYGFEMYYALLNCGFRITPTAGTASGVHPVPLGYSRVYVHTGEKFNSKEWLAGLKQGRSFVTTGPMLFAKIDGKLPGQAFSNTDQESKTLSVSIESVSEKPIDRIEILVNGKVLKSLKPKLSELTRKANSVQFDEKITIAKTSWVAIRSIELQPDGRKRFAHTAPWHIQLRGESIKPEKLQVQYFIDLMKAEVVRNRTVLRPESLSEFKSALSFYRKLLNQTQ